MVTDEEIIEALVVSTENQPNPVALAYRTYIYSFLRSRCEDRGIVADWYDIWSRLNMLVETGSIRRDHIGYYSIVSKYRQEDSDGGKL